jgi:hypothetical protein
MTATYGELAAAWRDRKPVPPRNAALIVPVQARLETSLAPSVLRGVTESPGSNHGQRVPAGLTQRGYRNAGKRKHYCQLDLSYTPCTHRICHHT